MSRVSSVVSAVVLAAGLIGLGYFVGEGLRHIRPSERYVNVRGLAEREVMADTAKLYITYGHTGGDPATIFPVLTETQKQVLAFLAKNGMKESEITVGQWSTSRASPEDIKNDPSIPRYTLNGNIEVITHDVAAVQALYGQVNDLRVATKGDVANATVNYSFTGLGPLRAEMIAAATKDARNAALQFAADSGSRVGAIHNASQGVFQISAAGEEGDNSESVHKSVRVVTTVDYELKD